MKTVKKSKTNIDSVPSLPVQETAFQPSSNSNRVLFILLVIVALFSVYLFLKMRNLEQKLAAGGGTGTQQNQGPNPLLVDSLKKYAKDLGMNTGKFNKCLDSGEKKAKIDADESYGASIGVQGTPGFFVNGRLLAGAFPFQFFQEIIDKEIQGKGSNNCADYSDNLKKYCQDPNPQNNPFNPVAQNINLGDSPSEGATNQKVTVVEFGDFQCPFCVRAYPTVKQILSVYKNDVRIYFKQYPLNAIHPYAEKSAEASECAKDQGKFWPYHDKLYGIQQQAGA